MAVSVTIGTSRVDITTRTVEILISTRGVAGPAGSVTSFTHTQASAASTWIVNHNLNRKPLAAVLSVGGVEIYGEIVHVNNNQLQVLFATPLAGSVRCI